MFARERERMSQWAIKQVCKFLLKKRLGDFILGDIDLDQLDVQLSQGTILLSDLALNVDLLNLKLAGSAVVVKAGSIGSLSVRIPWRLQNCQIEVEGLDLELMPAALAAGANAGSMQSTVVDKVGSDLGALPESATSSASLDIHEGVKQIAKMVNWFLTSFQVRLKNLIVGFHPRSDADEGGASDFRRSLVLRIAEIEYGTCVSEDRKTDSVLGEAKLTNFVEFHGAVVEFLKMDDVDCSLQENSCLGTSFSEWHFGSARSGSTVTVLTGAGGGFSGKLNLSIPWKNGSLDLRKVDADFSVDPVELCLQPNTIKWTIGIWESIKNVGVPSWSTSNCKAMDSPGAATLGFDAFKRSKGSFLKSISASVTEETFRDAVLPRRKVIHNYLSEKVETELEQDYGASIDQFFECFDGLRSSQAGSTGIWNWTCSVFSAITVASNLASGLGHIPIEQQNVETSLRANIAEVSVSLFFYDEDPESHDLMDSSKHLGDTFGAAHGSPHVNGQSSDPYISCFKSLNIEQSTITDIKSICPTIHHLEARCQQLLFNLQICPQNTNFEASVVHFKVDEYHDSRNQVGGSVFPVHSKKLAEQLLSNHNLWREIQASLPPFPFPVQEHDSEISVDKNAQKCQDGLIKVVLLESFGICSCHCSVSSTDVDGKKITSSSFAVNLPPFILWIHFQLVNVLLKLFKNVENYFEQGNAAKESLSGVMKEHHDSFFFDGLKSDSSTCITTVSSRASLQGKVLLPRARIILPLTSDCLGNFRNLTSLDKFIILELHPSGKGNAFDRFSFPSKNSLKCNPCAPSASIHFGIGDFDLYLVDSARKDAMDNKCGILGRLPHSAVKVLSGINKGDQQSGITMVCQKGPVTGPWMTSRAWSLASSQDQSRNKVAGKSCEFSSVTTGEDSEETSSNIRQELRLSSAFFLHVHFSQIWINLDDHAYKLLNEVMEGISNGICSTVTASSDSVKCEQLSPKVGASQASIFLDCDALNISIILNETSEINPSIQKELEGPWSSIRLTIEKLELLSVSNIGEVNDANFFWLNHGEGELWGSIFDRNEKAQNFLLVSCRNSTVGRGDGKVANALSFGLAGTNVLYLRNPQLIQSYTSITVRSGTLAAPGGRMDWISAICLFFSSHGKNETQSDDAQVESSTDGAANRGSFFLDLVDVALSYEPHSSTQISKKDPPDALYSSAVEVNGVIGEQHVACLLAAASLNFSNHSVTRESETINHIIQLKDIGLLICELSGSLNDNGGYYSRHLRKIGYVKVAQVAAVEAVLRIKGNFWEVDCSDSHINLDTCQDTTTGLVRLAGQLQQLYAPDMEDAVAHLQSRWNTVQRTHNENTSIEVEDNFDSSSVKSSCEMKLVPDSDECIYVGLLDEIHENAFDVKGDTKFSTDCSSQSHSSRDGSMDYDNNTSTVGDASSVNVPFTVSMHIGNKQKTYAPKTSLPQIIDSYCLSELHPPSKSNANRPTNGSKAKFDGSICREIECGKGGWYQDNSLTIVENHVSKSDHLESASLITVDEFRPVDSNATAVCREKGKIHLKNFDVRWKMYAGLDWSKPRKESNRSLYLQGRDESKCLELTLSGLDVRYGMHPDGEITLSKLSVCVQEFHLYDRSRDAPWKMVLGYYTSRDYPRESCGRAFKLDLEVVRPDPSTPIEDYRLHLEFLPMRLHLDQGQLNFLIDFFSNGSSAGQCLNLPNAEGDLVMSGRRSRTFGSQTVIEEALLPFFQKFDVKPVVVCIDYIPRHIDLAALTRGDYTQLLNLVPWKGIELQLKDVCAAGIYGWGSVCETVLGRWLEDISHNQVHKLLKGLAPIRSLYTVSSGTSKLVSLPVKSYRKDKRFLKGMQRGAIAFLRSISLEAVGLGVHLAAGAHEMLLQTEHILTSAPPSVSVSERSRPRATVRSNQPEDAHQGIHQAYESLSDGLGRTASALIGTPFKVYQRGVGAGSALAIAARAAPAAAIAPVAASARAVHYTLLGVRNSLDPEHKRESREKYLGPSRS